MNDKDKYQFLLEEKQQQQRKIEDETAILRAIETMLKKYAPTIVVNDKQEDKTITLPTDYNQDLTIPEKIFVALKTIGSGTVHDVADALVKLEPSYQQDKAVKDARNHLSKYYKRGKIDAKQGKKGRGYIYAVKQKDPEFSGSK